MSYSEKLINSTMMSRPLDAESPRGSIHQLDSRFLAVLDFHWWLRLCCTKTPDPPVVALYMHGTICCPVLTVFSEASDPVFIAV